MVLALNEAAVQLASSKALEQNEDIVKYYGISLPTKVLFITQLSAIC